MIVHITTGYHWETNSWCYTDLCAEDDVCCRGYPVCELSVWARLEEMARTNYGHGPIDWRELNRLVIKMFGSPE